MRIEIWSDVVCPWCSIGTARLESALADFAHRDEVEVVYRSFELDPSAPLGGTEPTTVALGRKYGRSPDEVRQMMGQVAAVAAEEGLTFRLEDTVHTNTVAAHRLLHLALDEGGPVLQRALKKAFLAAYFAEARDVGDPAVLTEVAVAAGLDPDRVAQVLGSQEYADAVAADVAQARAYGATGVPFFVVDQRYGISGAQPREVFAQTLEQAWAAAHPVLTTVGGSGNTGSTTGAAGSGQDGVCGPDGCPV